MSQNKYDVRVKRSPIKSTENNSAPLPWFLSVQFIINLLQSRQLLYSNLILSVIPPFLEFFCHIPQAKFHVSIPFPLFSPSHLVFKWHHGGSIEHFSHWSIAFSHDSLLVRIYVPCCVVTSVPVTMWFLFYVAVIVLFLLDLYGRQSFPAPCLFSFLFCTFLLSLSVIPVTPLLVLSYQQLWIFLHLIFIPSIQQLLPLKPPLPPLLSVYCGDICSLPRLLAACRSALWSDCCFSQNGAIH